MKFFNMMLTYVTVSPGTEGCRSYGGGNRERQKEL